MGPGHVTVSSRQNLDAKEFTVEMLILYSRTLG
jgi:hypothetical protein